MTTATAAHVVDERPFDYNLALVRPLPASFLQSLKEQTPSTPLDHNVARAQHTSYIELLRQLVDDVVEVEADESYPDCCFIEDTAIVVRDIAVICRPGHPSRRGEEVAVHRTLQSLSFLRIHTIAKPATLDGGDCLFTGNELLVGLSRRTNQHAIDQLSSFLPVPRLRTARHRRPAPQVSHHSRHTHHTRRSRQRRRPRTDTTHTLAPAVGPPQLRVQQQSTRSQCAAHRKHSRGTEWAQGGRAADSG